ncbi:MAG TPA: SpoIIE family protein phosphatase [Verrucomicrobiae bacterium]|jgi:sigma-B regulation protein RsbU (phosphoserine phosphatase)
MEHDSQSGPSRILLITSDEALTRRIEELLKPAIVTVALTVDASLVMISVNPFHAVLFDVPQAGAAALFQITFLTTKAARLPVLVIGPDDDDQGFLAETIYSGAQEYLGRGELTPPTLHHAIYCAVARQEERIGLMEEKENYYGIFDHLVEGIFRTTVDGHYLLANVALSRIYGYNSPVELMANIKDIASKLYVEPGRREEFVRLMQENDTLSGFESRIFRKDGSIIWIAENCRAVRDSSGNVLYYEGTVEDITRQRQIEEALRSSESLYHSLVETMPQNVFRKDREGRFTFVNRQFCEQSKCQPEDILGKTDFDLFPKDLAQQYQRDDELVMTTGQSREIIEEHHRAGQEPATVQVVKTPLYDHAGKIIGLQGIFWDITEKKRAEEKIRKTTAELGRSREELRVKNAIMEENLRMAGEIQMAMLPQQYPVFPPNSEPEQSAFQFVHRYHPSEAVSGDFFAVSRISATEVGVFICDVTGHGVRAALVTAMVRALVEELKSLAREPGEFLRKLNYDLYNILKNTGTPMLTTAFYLVADSRTGALRYANAGHPKPLIVRRAQKQVELLANACGRGQPALGLYEEPIYETSTATLSPGDFLMLFTDGLYEVQGQNEELYSQQRLMLDVKTLIDRPPAILFDELIGSIRAFSFNGEFDDDVCLVGMDFAGTKTMKS